MAAPRHRRRRATRLARLTARRTACKRNSLRNSCSCSSVKEPAARRVTAPHLVVPYGPCVCTSAVAAASAVLALHLGVLSRCSLCPFSTTRQSLQALVSTHHQPEPPPQEPPPPAPMSAALPRPPPLQQGSEPPRPPSPGRPPSQMPPMMPPQQMKEIMHGAPGDFSPPAGVTQQLREVRQQLEARSGHPVPPSAASWLPRLPLLRSPRPACAASKLATAS